MIKHTETIRRKQSASYLSMFDPFVGMALKGLTQTLGRSTSEAYLGPSKTSMLQKYCIIDIWQRPQYTLCNKYFWKIHEHKCGLCMLKVSNKDARMISINIVHVSLLSVFNRFFKNTLPIGQYLTINTIKQCL